MIFTKTVNVTSTHSHGNIGNVASIHSWTLTNAFDKRNIGSFSDLRQLRKCYKNKLKMKQKLQHLGRTLQQGCICC
jgi:hypothetical protein